MSLLSDPDRQAITEVFANLVHPVKLLFFTQAVGCEMCLPTRQILDEVVPLSAKLALEEVNFVLDKDIVAQYGVEQVPAVVMTTSSAEAAGGEGSAPTRDTGIHFYGAPLGYEFSNFIDAIQLIGTGESDLSEATREALRGVTSPLRIQVFTTPT
jgi:hypothetical protein